MSDPRFPGRPDYPGLKWLDENVLSPTLVIFLSGVRHNIRTILRALGGDARRWRPHVKTVKIPEVLRELIRAGVRRFKCATSKEARVLLETLASERIDGADLLVAYPCRGPMLEAVAALARRYPESNLSVLVESTEAVHTLDSKLRCFIDLDPGMRRTGVPVQDVRLILDIGEQAGERLVGLHHYEGHLAGLEPEQRRAKAHACFDELIEVITAMEAAGLRSGEVITSGTPTFLDALSHAGLSARKRGTHTISPGTVIYHDLNSEREIPNLELQPSALLFSRVVSRPGDGILTFDAGSKSLATEVDGPAAIVWGEPAYQAGAPSEEHFPWVVPGKESSTGTKTHSSVLMVPAHVCPTVNLAQEAVLVPIEGEPFVVEVSARAHDVVWK